jgi:cell division protein ZapA (FtsZ GTPase activity inhibitor)
LTALNIADDLLKEKEQRKALVREVEVKSKDLVEKINVRMAGKEAKKIQIVE